MSESRGCHVVIRFGVFELDTVSGELRRHGLKVRLAEQPVQILQLLLEHPGEVVTREQLRQRLWPSGTHVDFDLGLNSAVRKLREVLDDSADSPRFLETLPRRGYRFIGPVIGAQPVAAPKTRHLRTWTVIGAIVIAAVATLAVGYARRPTSRSAKDIRAIDPVAHDLYIKALKTTGRENYEQFRDALVYLEQAVARQPEFAEAHAAIATVQFQFFFVGPLAPREAVPKAEAAARRAIALDDSLADPHRILGLILHDYYWRWDDGDRELARARALSQAPHPTDIFTLVRRGRLREAVEWARGQCTRDPRSIDAAISLAIALRANHDFDAAIAEMRRAIQLQPQSSRAYFQLGATLVLAGKAAEAVLPLETALQLSTARNPRFQAYLGYAYAASGRPVEARAVIAEIEARRRQQYVSSYGLALIYDALGEKEAALAAFLRAYEDHALEFAQVAHYPPFRAIAAEPAFVARMHEIGG